MTILTDFMANPPGIIWPLGFMLLALIVVRQLFQDIRPIVVSVVKGVTVQAQSNAPAYAVAILFGLSASLSAFVDVFRSLDHSAITALSWHQYATLWAKVLNPFIVAVLAYATQNKFKAPPGTVSTTTTNTVENTNTPPAPLPTS